MVDSSEVEISTDFAILVLEQDPGSGPPSGPYATSSPGSVAMMAGTKYAEMDVRVERWDAKPPPAGDEWEDQDVLPWRSIDGRSAARLRGFDDVADGEVSLDGLDRARVEILAWGRNRYYYGGGPDDWDGVPRERWLLRFWPDPHDLDALAGPPRRLIGRSWLPAPTNGFWASVDALRTTGWWPALGYPTPFAEIFQALYYQRGAFRMEELPPSFVAWTWDTEVGRTGRNDGDLMSDRVQAVGRAAGIEILTYRDALRALIALGVFATVETPNGQKLVPNPAPPVSVWEIVEPASIAGYDEPRAHEFDAYRALSEDLLHQARWAQDGVLRATPERIASRLGLSLDEVLCALKLLAALGHNVEPMPAEDIDAGAEVALSAATR